MDHIIRIDMQNKLVKYEKIPEEYKYLGGRGLTSTLLLNEVNPTCHPLGKNNKLVIAPGLLSGTTLSSSNRLSFGAKSPLTGGIKESNSGGVVAYKLARLGIKAIVIEENPIDNELICLKINKDGVSFDKNSEINGRGTYYSTKKLFEKYGSTVGIMLIGMAGERRLASACINCTDVDGDPCRTAGRGGLGAILGSKGIKAIIVDDKDIILSKTKTTESKEIVKEFARELRKNPVTGELLRKYGTAKNILLLNNLKGLPTRNFSMGQFENAKKISGEKMAELIKKRGGETTHGCMPGCVIQCSNIYVDKNGVKIVSSLEYETICLLGSNLGIDNLDAIAIMNRLCNDIGVDTIETGAALGVLAEAGELKFGDTNRAIELLKEVENGTPLGRLIASGAGACGIAYGVSKVPIVKNQAIPAYDPRVIKGNGVTYATSPMGADHTYANTIILPINHTDKEGKVESSKNLQIEMAIMDTLGICVFAWKVLSAKLGLRERILKLYTGWEAEEDDLRRLGKIIVLRERAFNKKAGFTKYHDRLPEFILSENLKPQNAVFDITDEEIDAMF